MNVLCAGRMKEGKTTLAIYLAQQWSPGVIIWDPRHMIGDNFIEKENKATFVYTGDELEDAIDDKKWLEGPIIFRPDALRLEQDFQELAHVLFDPPEKYAESGFAIVIDEAAQLQHPQSILPELDVIVRQHPRSVLVVQCTHSLQDWHRASKDLMSALYCFRQVGRSLHMVVEYCDGDEEMEEVIKTLPRHWCMMYNFEAAANEVQWSVLDEPELWYSPATEGIHQQDASGNSSREESTRTA